LLGQLGPDPAVRRILLRLRAELAGIHKFDKPAAIHLKRPQPAEQLLALIQLRRRQADGRLLNRTIRCSVDG